MAEIASVRQDLTFSVIPSLSIIIIFGNNEHMKTCLFKIDVRVRLHRGMRWPYQSASEGRECQQTRAQQPRRHLLRPTFTEESHYTQFYANCRRNAY